MTTPELEAATLRAIAEEERRQAEPAPEPETNLGRVMKLIRAEILEEAAGVVADMRPKWESAWTDEQHARYYALNDAAAAIRALKAKP